MAKFKVTITQDYVSSSTVTVDGVWADDARAAYAIVHKQDKAGLLSWHDDPDYRVPDGRRVSVTDAAGTTIELED